MGLEDVDQEDIDELLQSHRQELSNEDLLEMEEERKRETEQAAAAAAGAADKTQGQIITAKRLREAMGKINEGFAILEEIDPNVERSSTAQRLVMDNLFCYTEMLKEFQKKKSQTSMLQYFQKTRLPETVEVEVDVHVDVDDPEEVAGVAVAREEDVATPEEEATEVEVATVEDSE